MGEDLADFVFGSDILSKTNFKPWWETLRGYAVFGLFIVAVLIIYTMKPSTSVICFPAGNATSEFENIEADDVKIHCSKFAPGSWFFLNIGYVALAAVILIQLLCCWWLFVPRVQFSFRSLRSYDDEIGKLQDSVNDINDIILFGDVATEEQLKKKKAEERKVYKIVKSVERLIQEMNAFQPANQMMTIPVIYVVRDIMAFIAICASMYVLSIAMHAKEEEELFSCVVQSVRAECRYDVVSQLRPYIVIGMILLSVTGAICLVTVFTTTCKHRRMPTKLQILNRPSDYAFVIYFGENSTPISISADEFLEDPYAVPVVTLPAKLNSKNEDVTSETEPMIGSRS